MGCDIHFYVERQDDDGAWHLFTPFDLLRRRHPELSPLEVAQAGDTIKRASPNTWQELEWRGSIFNDGTFEGMTLEQQKAVFDETRDDYGDQVSDDEAKAYVLSSSARFYRGRWYNLFAKLADVRNAREGDEDHITPISQPRGIPEDASPLGRAVVEAGGDHSHSWLTLQELLDGMEGWDLREHFDATLKLMAEVGPPNRVRALFSFDS